MSDRKIGLIFIATVLGGIVGGLLFVVFKVHVSGDLSNVLMILVGMLSVSSLSTLSGVYGRDAPLTMKVSFDLNEARRKLENVLAVDFRDISDATTVITLPWEPTADRLLQEDPVLALAKLRIDIERELRRIAFEAKIEFDLKRISINKLLESLIKVGVIEPNIVSAIRDVLPVCNQAVHGGDINANIALQVLSVGDDIVLALRQEGKPRPFHSRASVIP